MSTIAKTSVNFTQPAFKSHYDNFIGGKWQAPVNGEYFESISPVDGQVFTKVARSNEADIEKAIDAAWAAAPKWNNSSATERSNILLKIADKMEQNLATLAQVETWDNGKPIRETTHADLPLAIDHFRYFAGVIRAEEGSAAELDSKTLSLIVHEPLGVVGQIIPWNFPLLMAAWKLAPALAAGNCVVLKPAEQTPVGIMVWAEMMEDIIPAGVLNIVNGYGVEAGKPLALNTRINKIAFTGSTEVGKIIASYAAKNVIPYTLELGGKSPNIFFEDVMNADDDFFDKCLEGAAMFALNQGEVCTCPSRLLVQESIYEKFMERLVERVQNVKMGHPLDPETMMGAQASEEQYDKILGYIDLGKEEGAEVLCGGGTCFNEGLAGGYYIQPTILKGTNKMRVFQEEIFGPVLCVTTFKDEKEALEIANDTEYGLGAGVWTRDMHKAYEISRGIQAGRIWVNCYHAYPAHAPFGGYKKSGVGRETHKMMLNHYRQTKNMLISYSKNKLGFF
jgi:aldehyde dehydrogenase